MHGYLWRNEASVCENSSGAALVAGRRFRAEAQHLAVHNICSSLVPMHQVCDNHERHRLGWASVRLGTGIGQVGFRLDSLVRLSKIQAVPLSLLTKVSQQDAPGPSEQWRAYKFSKAYCGLNFPERGSEWAVVFSIHAWYHLVRWAWSFPHACLPLCDKEVL